MSLNARRYGAKFSISVRRLVVICLATAACVSDDPAETELDVTADTVVARLLLDQESPPDERGSGWLVTDRTDSVTYGARELRVRDDRYLRLDSLTGRVDGRAQWKVVEVMRLPQLQPGEFFVGGVCRLNGQLDRRIAAIVSHGEVREPYFRTVRSAWIANPARHRFETLAVQGIDCEDVGFPI